jgi:hypothetical protein
MSGAGFPNQGERLNAGRLAEQAMESPRYRLLL